MIDTQQICVEESNWVETLGSISAEKNRALTLKFDPDKFPARPWDFAPFDELYAHWHSLRDGNNIPKKSDLKLHRLRSLVSEVAILERVEDKLIYRLRAAGLAEQTGVDLEGRDMLEFYTAEAKEAALRESDIVNSTPCASFLVSLRLFENGWRVPTENLSLPLCDDDGTIRFAIVLMHVRDKVALRRARLSDWIGWEVQGTRFCDIGFGAPSSPTPPKTHMSQKPA